jgi:hypothetical protein
MRQWLLQIQEMEKALVQRTEGAGAQDLWCLQKRFLLGKTFGVVSPVLVVSNSCGVFFYALGPGSLL